MKWKFDVYTLKRRAATLFYFMVLFGVMLVFIIELKHTYNINIFPNVNGKLDDIYFGWKDKF